MTYRSNKIRVCLIIEGAYPYILGGVSVWVHQLISKLPTFDFILWNIVPQKNDPYKFKLPQNVVEVKEISLSDKLKWKPRKLQPQKQWNAIHHFHDLMEKGEYGAFTHFYHKFTHETSGLSPENLLKDIQGWHLITQKYNINHPISPFIQYYWAWRAVHIPLFQMLQAPIPDADIYHAVSTGYAGLLGTIARLKQNKPFILTEHGIYAKERELEVNQAEQYIGYQKRIWKKNFKGLAKVAYAHADLIIALYHKNQQIQIDMGAPPEKCKIIPNGIHINEFSNLPKKSHKLFNVGYIGRIVQIKDVKNFIMAARIIKDEIPTAHFYIIGPENEQKKYFQEVLILIDNLNMKAFITFTGKADVRKYFPLLDVLCLTSIKEAQPLAVIESLVAGVPVVASDVGDVRDILQQDGIVVPPKSPDKLAEGVVQFAQNPQLRRQCIQNGKKRAMQMYDIQQLIQTYGDIYQQFKSSEVVKWRA